MKKLIAVMLIVAMGVFAASANAETVVSTDYTTVKRDTDVNEGHHVHYYSGHVSMQEEAFIRFDMSAYAGQTVGSDGIIHLEVTINDGENRGGQGSWDYTMQMYQVHANNADADLPDASGMHKDISAGLQWLDAGGSPLADLMPDNVPQMSDLIWEHVSPPSIPGDVHPDYTQDFFIGDIVSVNTVPQAILQQWCDGTLPPLVLLTSLHTGDPGGMILRFGNDSDPVLEFSLGGPVIPEPAGLGLVGLALLAVRKRRS